MNKTIRLLTVALSVAIGLSSEPANANFSGPYDISKWTISQNGVNTSEAPSFVTLYDYSLLRGEPLGSSRLTITAAAESLVSFNWNFFVPLDYDISANDFSFLFKTHSTELKPMYSGPYSGSVSQHVHAGDIFGFDSCCHDNHTSFGYVTISDFNVTAVPEPETYAMLLAGLGVIGFMARRRKQTAM
jgi:hypothetical protein